MYIVTPSYVSILGCGGSYLKTFMLVDTDRALPSLVFFQETPEWMNILGASSDMPIIVPLDNLVPEVRLSGELSGTLKFGGRITPGGGYYFTNGTTTMLVNSAVGTCVYKSAPYRFPYRFAYDGDNYGDKIYKGKLPLLYSFTDETLAEQTPQEWTLEYDSSKIVEVSASASIGWWQKSTQGIEPDLPNGGGLYGKYIGKGAYSGRSMIVGGATWMLDNSVKITKHENEQDDSPPNYGDYIYDATTDMWWLDGEVFDDDESTDPPYPEYKKYEYLSSPPQEGADATIHEIVLEQGGEAPIYSTKTAVWAGYMGDVAKYQTYICDTPVWREEK